MPSRSHRPFALASTCLLLLAAGGRTAAGGEQGKPPKERPAGADAKAAETRIINLKNAAAREAADVLRKIFGGQDKGDPRLAVAADERTNAIVLRGPAAVVAD